MEKIIYILLLIILENDFYKNITTIHNPTSYDFLVNKNNKLTSDYIPDDLEVVDIKYSCKDKYLRHEARINFEKMAMDAKEAGFNIIAVSTYRSYLYQKKLYNNYGLNNGFYYADMASARAGHSEHQTGLAVDVADKSLDYDNFESTKEFIWMKENCYKYGFILRYPKGKFHITGFKYEPWHYRYVGIEIATYIYKNNLTFEEYVITKNN
ncbi:MAG: M15 family metallopeptidase [Bacilli bacterium]|nr:M15 family metallopeptidase [Bacilli bacterium]